MWIRKGTNGINVKDAMRVESVFNKVIIYYGGVDNFTELEFSTENVAKDISIEIIESIARGKVDVLNITE